MASSEKQAGCSGEAACSCLCSVPKKVLKTLESLCEETRFFKAPGKAAIKLSQGCVAKLSLALNGRRSMGEEEVYCACVCVSRRVKDLLRESELKDEGG